MPTSLLVDDDRKVAAAPDGHFFHGDMNAFVLIRCHDRRSHMFCDGIVERGRAAGANRMKDVAFR